MLRATQALGGVILSGWLTVASLVSAQVSAQVDCGSGNTLARALREAQPGDTLRVAGTCNEFVTITTDRITLDGLGSAILDAGGAGAAVITVEGAQGVLIRGLTVRNSDDGLLVQRAAAVIMDAVIAEDNTGDGFQIDENATVRMRDCTAQRNRDNGMEVRRSANVTIEGSIVSRDNAFHGMSIFDAASVVFSGVQAEITGNERSGINLSIASGLTIEGSAVQGGSNVNVNVNSSDGIQVSGNSHLGVTGGSSILASQNNRNGLLVLGSSSVLSFGTIHATANGVDGIEIARTSTLEIGGEGILTSENNTDTGLSISSLAVGIAFDATTVTLRNNGNLDCIVTSNSQWDAFGTVNIVTTQTCNPSSSLALSSTLRSGTARKRETPSSP